MQNLHTYLLMIWGLNEILTPLLNQSELTYV